MAYESLITDSGLAYKEPTSGTAQGLIPLEYANEVIGLAPAHSVALSTFRKVTMSHAAEQVPVLSVLPEAEWVTNAGVATPKGESYGALESTTNAGWKGVFLTAQTAAVNCPIPRPTLNDAGYPIWEQVTPQIAAKVGLLLDSATLFGYNTPFAAPALVPKSVEVGNFETKGTHSTEEGGFAHDISAAFNQVEGESGFVVDGAIASRKLLYAARNIRSTLGTQIPVASGYQIDENEWYGVNVNYLAAPGLWPQPETPAEIETNAVVVGKSLYTLKSPSKTTNLKVGDHITGTNVPTGTVVTKIVSTSEFEVNTKVETEIASTTKIKIVAPVALVGDFSQAIIGLRQDLEFQVFEEGVITNSAGEVTMNLMTQNMVNLRVTARFGYAVANSVTYYQPEESKRYPFSVIFA